MLSTTHDRLHQLTRLNGRRRLGLLLVFSLAALALPASQALAAQPPVGLGVADGFAVLAGSAVTNTGPSTINGDLGISPGTAITGFPPGAINGAKHDADAAAADAKSALTTAYNDAAGRTPAAAVSGNLGGLTLTPGVYNSASSLGLTGQLTLNAEGNPNAVFIFQAGSTLTTASASKVLLINGARSCDVFWKVGSSATLGTTSVFAGNILAHTTISANQGVTVYGRVLAGTGAVMLIDDTITPSSCATVTGTTTTSGSSTTSVTTTTSGTSGSGKSGTSGSANPGTSGSGKSGTSGGGKSGTSGSGATKTRNGAAVLAALPLSWSAPKSTSTSSGSGSSGSSSGICVRPAYRVAVTGRRISRVVFYLGTKVISRRTKAPYLAVVTTSAAVRRITALVSFTDSTPAAKLSFPHRA